VPAVPAVANSAEGGCSTRGVCASITFRRKE
jgi:hypothetical protein